MVSCLDLPPGFNQRAQVRLKLLIRSNIQKATVIKPEQDITSSAENDEVTITIPSNKPTFLLLLQATTTEDALQTHNTCISVSYSSDHGYTTQEIYQDLVVRC